MLLLFLDRLLNLFINLTQLVEVILLVEHLLVVAVEPETDLVVLKVD
jgi:hypothetical protein